MHLLGSKRRTAWKGCPEWIQFRSPGCLWHPPPGCHTSEAQRRKEHWCANLQLFHSCQGTSHGRSIVGCYVHTCNFYYSWQRTPWDGLIICLMCTYCCNFTAHARGLCNYGRCIVSVLCAYLQLNTTQLLNHQLKTGEHFFWCLWFVAHKKSFSFLLKRKVEQDSIYWYQNAWYMLLRHGNCTSFYDFPRFSCQF